MAVIPTGLMTSINVPWDCKITEVEAYATAGTPGSIQIDVWKTTHELYDLGPAAVHPVDGDSITGTNPIVITNDDKMRDTTLTGWKVHLNKGDVLAFNVDSVTNIERVTINLTLETT